ncbi:MAG: hypothetical protein PHH13_05465 [Candidatus Peribacteraceae bacterium]|nr:hypothetical protein [Candidatus Peribacteraceae bacterium]
MSTLIEGDLPERPDGESDGIGVVPEPTIPVEHDPLERPKGEGDGIRITEKQLNGRTVLTLVDTLWHVSLAIEVETKLAQRRQDFLHEYLRTQLVKTLSKKPLQVGVYSNGKANGSDKMPE